jgi:hypothetical protein
MSTLACDRGPAGRGLPAAILLTCAIVLSACATTPDTGQAGAQGGLPGVLEEVRRNPEDRTAGESYCRLALAQRTNAFPYGAFFGGLFAVPAAQGDRAFCAALVEAVIADELTEADLAVFKDRKRSKAPLGTLLRKLMVAHLRLSTQQAALPRETAGRDLP